MLNRPGVSAGICPPNSVTVQYRITRFFVGQFHLPLHCTANAAAAAATSAIAALLVPFGGPRMQDGCFKRVSLNRGTGPDRNEFVIEK